MLPLSFRQCPCCCPAKHVSLEHRQVMSEMSGVAAFETIRSAVMQARTLLTSNPTRQSSRSRPPFGIWLAGLTSRTLFIAILAVATIRVASPQTERIWSAYETPGDLIRMLLGFALCLWLVVHLFIVPKDAEGYRTWMYLSPLVPLALFCTIAIW